MYNIIYGYFLFEIMHIIIVKKEENKMKSSKNSSDDDWKRLEKWHFGRANFP